MTITTAKGRGMALRLAPLALAQVLGGLLLSADCHAEVKFAPNFTVRETWTDNATQQADGQSQSQLITDIAPGFRLTDNSRRLKANVDAKFDLFGYSNTDPEAKRYLANSAWQYNAHAVSEVIDELFYVDAGATRARSSTSAFGPLNNNLYSNVNRGDISTWTISPWLHQRFGRTADATVRFTRDSVQGGAVGFGNSLASTRTATLASEGDPTFGWSLNYNHQDLTDRVNVASGPVRDGRSSSETEVAAVRYKVNRTFSLTVDGGYDSFDYETLGSRTAGRRWSAGFIYVPSSRTTMKASFGHRYFGKTGMLQADHRTRHTVWSLSYVDDVTTSRSQFLVPAAIDTAAMLDRLFLSQFPDATQRQQAVQAYMAATGLPPTLAESINFLSNRYIRDKRLQGAAVWRMAHSDLTLTVFRDERTALSLQQTDSLLLGTERDTLNDNVRQRGASLDFNQRLSSRTTVVASIQALHATSLVTGIGNYGRTIRAGVTRKFGPRATGSLEARRGSGGLGAFSSRGYHENAIVALYNVQY